MTTAIINEIGKYLRETVEDFDVRVEIALNTMDRKRCRFGYADSVTANCVMSATTELRSGVKKTVLK